jgi:DedD protein
VRGLLVAIGLCVATAGAAPALRNAVEYIVPVVALADADNLQRLVDRLAKARIPYYFEPIATVRGTVHRVRVGPFADRAAAAKAIGQLEAMGLKPGAVFTRP